MAHAIGVLLHASVEGNKTVATVFELNAEMKIRARNDRNVTGHFTPADLYQVRDGGRLRQNLDNRKQVQVANRRSGGKSRLRSDAHFGNGVSVWFRPRLVLVTPPGPLLITQLQYTFSILISNNISKVFEIFYTLSIFNLCRHPLCHHRTS